MLPTWSLIYGFAFGAVIGSFLNMLIYRLPNRLSIVEPRHSICPACKHRLGGRDLIPLLSFLVQRGRCRYCHVSIPPRYFFVELGCAALWTYLWWLFLIVHFAPLSFIVYALSGAGLLAIFFIDLQYYIIPDELNAILLGLGMVHAMGSTGALNGWEWSRFGVISWQNALLGAEISAAIFCVIALAGRLLFRKDAMGHGDIKLARAVGALLMLPAALASFGLAIALGAVIGGAWTILQGTRNKERGARVLEAKGERENLTGRREDGKTGRIDPKSDGDEPEPVRVLLVSCLFYLLWLDVPIAFLPHRTQDRVYARISRSMGVEPELEEVSDEPVAPGMLPFGPFIVLGVLSVIVFNESIKNAILAYLRWAIPAPPS